MLQFLSTYGILATLPTAVFINLFDTKSLSKKLCHHFSNEELETFYNIQVFYLKGNLYEFK